MGDSYMTWMRKGVSVFFEYDTPKIVHIKSKKVGVLSRFVQACILAYIIGYVIVYQKGYQKFEKVESAVTTKLKGVAYTNFTDEELVGVPAPWKYLYRRVWDVTDYVVPPSENNAFFITTNVIITPNQTQGACAEDANVPGAACNPANNTCTMGATHTLGHGITTGNCVQSQVSLGYSTPHSCEILAWCPVEIDKKPLGSKKAMLEASRNFTVLIKNQIEFPLYNKRRTNILESSNQTYLSSCLYNNETDPFCPVFRLDTIVKLAGEEYSKISVDGAVVSVGINWDCDLDHDFMTNCRPDYRFRRLDNPHAKIAPGWNFRHSDYYGNNARTLYKSYGILFVVDVQGSAGKFNFIPFFLNVGAGLALLGIATVICDIIVLYCMKESDVYRDKKYLLVKGKDAFAVYRRQEDEDGEDVGGKEDVVVETDEEGTAADSNTVVQRRVGRLAAAAASS